MSDDFHYYEPRSGHGLPHDPFKALIAPRPIGWISTVAEDGTFNLAPYSFFNAFSFDPPIIAFASTGFKDSVTNIEATGVFGWNLATRDLAEPMNQSCASVDPSVDEFELAGLTPIASKQIAAPRVAEAPVSFECRLSQILRLTGADGKNSNTWAIFGEVVGVYIARHLLVDGVYDTAAARPIMRAGGPADYFEIAESHRFQMERPG